MNITKIHLQTLRAYELAETKIVFVTCHIIERKEYKMIVASNMTFPEDIHRQEYVLDLLDDLMIGQRAFLSQDEQAVFVTQYTPNFALRIENEDNRKKSILPYEQFVTSPYYGKGVSQLLTESIMDIFTRTINEMGIVLITRKHYEPFKLSYETNLYKTIDEKVSSKVLSGRAIFRQSYMVKKSQDIKVYTNVGGMFTTRERKYKACVRLNVIQRIMLWLNKARKKIEYKEKEKRRMEDYERYKIERAEKRKKNSRRKKKLDIYGDPIIVDRPVVNQKNSMRKPRHSGMSNFRNWKPEWKNYHVTMRQYNLGFVTLIKPWVYSSPVINYEEYIGRSDLKIGDIIKKVTKIPRHLKRFVTIDNIRKWINGDLTSLDEAKVKFLMEVNNIMNLSQKQN